MILNEDEVICDKCNGTGFWEEHDLRGQQCYKCLGKGKLDWVTNAMGKSNGILVWGQKTLKSYNGRVVIDNVKGVSGTTYPIGTAAKPVNNLADAKIIAKEKV